MSYISISQIIDRPYNILDIPIYIRSEPFRTMRANAILLHPAFWGNFLGSVFKKHAHFTRAFFPKTTLSLSIPPVPLPKEVLKFNPSTYFPSLVSQVSVVSIADFIMGKTLFNYQVLESNSKIPTGNRYLLT